MMPQVSVYLKQENLDKLNRVKGNYVKRSTLLNQILLILDEDWLESLLK